MYLLIRINILSYFSRQCAPCMVPYDAIIKLESNDEEEYVMVQTGLSKNFPLHDLSSITHQTKGGSSSKHRTEVLQEIPCSLLTSLAKHFILDLEMFEYDIKDFMKICQNTE